MKVDAAVVPVLAGVESHGSPPGVGWIELGALILPPSLQPPPGYRIKPEEALTHDLLRDTRLLR